MGSSSIRSLSLFTPWERSWASSSSNFYPLEEREDAVKVPLHTPMSPNLFCFFFSPLSIETSPLEILTSTKSLSSMGSFPRKCFPGAHTPEARGSKSVNRILLVPQSGPRSVCLFPDAQVA